MSSLNAFLTGAIAMASLVAALFFLRFWRQTHDSFFLFLTLSFALEGAARGASSLLHLGDDNPALYGVRLLAYGCILLAIWQKNRR